MGQSCSLKGLGVKGMVTRTKDERERTVTVTQRVCRTHVMIYLFQNHMGDDLSS